MTIKAVHIRVMTIGRLLVLLVICLSGCQHDTVAPSVAAHLVYDPQIVYPGTKSYEQRIASFKLTPEAARQAGGQPTGLSGPNCVIDDWYLFSKPYKYKRIDLGGTYVNGLTGQVEHRESELSLLDNSVLGALKSFPADMPKHVSEARRWGTE